MKFLLDEICRYSETAKKNASSKARDDIKTILSDIGFSIISKEVVKTDATSLIEKIIRNIKRDIQWFRFYRNNSFKSKDILLIQYPIIDFSLGFLSMLKRMKKINVNTILLVHDIETLRFKVSKFFAFKEKKSFAYVSYIICHNNKMKEYLIKQGVDSEKIICLEIFDYLISSNIDTKRIKENGIDIAGNLSIEKCGYIYDIDIKTPVNLYGIGYDAKNKKHNYLGAFSPEELVTKLIGGFGLVWDGTSSETCCGNYGEYLKYNNPHKTSLYLAAGEPVIVWKHSAIADFIKNNKCGIVVESISEIDDIIENLSDEEYFVLKENAERIGERLRRGYYTKKALEKIILLIDKY